MTTDSTGQDVVNSLIHAIWNQATEESSAEVNYPLWGFNDYELDIEDEQLQGLSGPGVGILTSEGQQYGSNERTRDYPSSFTLRKYTSELSVTEELQHWLSKASPRRKVQQIRTMVENALQAVQYNLDFDVAQMFFLGFGTTFFTGGDTLALFSGSHTIRSTGGTQSNLFADTHRVFTADNLVTAINRMNRFRGMNNVQLRPVKRARVLCSVENGPEVQRVLESEYGPNTANLGKSSASAALFKGRGVMIDYAVIDKMSATYENYWFVVDLDRAATRAHLGVGWKPRLSGDTDVRKGTEFTEASTLVGPSALGWQWVLGSTGTGLAV